MANLRHIIAILLVSLSAMRAECIMSPRQALALGEQEAKGECDIRGTVTFVSGTKLLWFVIAPEDKPNHPGMAVYPKKGSKPPSLGDVVRVKGTFRWNRHTPEVVADNVYYIRSTTLPTPPEANQADFRLGKVANRVVTINGTVVEIRKARTSSGEPYTELGIEMKNYIAVAQLPGIIDSHRVLDAPVRVIGFVHNQYAPDGTILDAWIELVGESAIILRSKNQVPLFLLVIAITVSLIVLFLMGMFLTLWLIDRRKRRELEVISAERKRMAADLHDTIEQHLAGASLLAAGISSLPDASDSVKDAMKTLSGVLSNAKAEVRSAVLNLRQSDGKTKPLCHEIDELCVRLKAIGINAKCCLKGLSDRESTQRDVDVLMIIREAVTNAIKHGKARRLLFTSEPDGDGGVTIRVFNNGEPFDADNALGPETGHYGISGMKVRAFRHGIGISWGRHKSWTFVQLTIKES